MPLPLEPRPMIELTILHCDANGQLQGTAVYIHHAEWVTDPVNVLARISSIVGGKLDQAVKACDTARTAGPKGPLP